MAKKKPTPPEELLLPGESVKMSCNHCDAEYEVTFEPGKPPGYVAGRIPPGFCPFCGDDDVYAI